ncbi:diguanylate cyclase [Blastococcus sp. URHD0036]|uniref:diguanylate cyclase n=1 Tax=Blastococcus sp. URHD0036 TaxID=1380356 RepID=UPI00068E4D11|nr:diguanylate cyclase [Blastococcus sp. URHD0036]
MTLQAWWPLFACAAVVALGILALAWQRRSRTPAATALAVTVSGVAVWSAADAALYGTTAAVVRQAYPAVLMVGVGVVVAGVYGLSRTVADPSWQLSRRVAVSLAVEPLLLVLAAALPATRGLVLAVPESGTAAEVEFGPLFLAHSGYSYVLLAVAYLHLARRRRSAAGVFRRQLTVLLGTAVLSTVGNVVAVVLQGDGHGVDLTPLFFLLTGLVDCWAIFRLGLLQVVPVARDRVVDTVPDAVLVVDPEGRVLDLNPAAVRMLERTRPGVADGILGRFLQDVAGPEAVAVLGRAADRDGSRLAEVAPGVWLDVRTSPISDPRGRALGRIVVVRDVSEEQGRRLAVEALNRQLAEQLVEIERLRAALAEEAVRDPLTGLHNRRHLDRALDAALATAPDGTPVAVVLVDVDHFKTVNDRFGHAVGDRVLQSVAGVLTGAARPGDVVARYGGEEFLVLLPGAGRGEAAARAEEIRRRCAGLLDRDGAAVTVSAGVAATPDDGDDAAMLLAGADRALYAAKAAGRDRVVVSAGLGAPVG